MLIKFDLGKHFMENGDFGYIYRLSLYKFRKEQTKDENICFQNETTFSQGDFQTLPLNLLRRLSRYQNLSPTCFVVLKKEYL